MSEGDLAELRSQLLVAGPRAWAAFRQLAEASLRVLCEQAQAPDWRYRRVAIEALASHALVSRARQVIVVALGDASPYVARTACEAVGRLAIPQARPGISALARDPDSATREAALRAWAAVWRPEDFEPVYQIYAQDKVEQVRREAAGLLRQHADAASWQRLFAAWSMAPFGRHRVWACDSASRRRRLLYGNSCTTRTGTCARPRRGRWRLLLRRRIHPPGARPPLSADSHPRDPVGGTRRHTDRR
jgi:hypothetical protein